MKPLGFSPGVAAETDNTQGAEMVEEQRQLTLLKKGEYYVFRYLPGEEARMISVLMEKAQDPKSPIDWFDAAVLSHQMGHRMADQMQKLLKDKLSTNTVVKKAADAT